MPLRGFASFLGPVSWNPPGPGLSKPSPGLAGLAGLRSSSSRYPVEKTLAGLFDGLVMRGGFLFWNHSMVDQRVPVRQSLGQWARLSLSGFLFRPLWPVPEFNSNEPPDPVILVTPSLWVVLEYLRANLSFLAFPWALLGHTQYSNLPITQMAAVTGVYGVSFVVMLVNAALADLWVMYVLPSPHFSPLPGEREKSELLRSQQMRAERWLNQKSGLPHGISTFHCGWGRNRRVGIADPRGTSRQAPQGGSGPGRHSAKNKMGWRKYYGSRFFQNMKF